jgi:surface antigen
LTWRPSARAAGGSWRLVALCRRLDNHLLLRRVARYRLRGASGHAPLWTRRKLAVDLVPGALPSGRGGGGGNPIFSQPGVKYQCTWWADMQRPDIYLAATAHGVPKGGYADPVSGDAYWDAWRWAQNAARGGLPEGHRAVVGAIVVYPRTNTPAGHAGHVAYVDAVNANGSYHITEYNHVPNQFSARWMPAPRDGDGIVFIYGGPAGTPSFATVNGPGATPVCTALQGGCPGPIQGGGSPQAQTGNPQGSTGSPQPAGGSSGGGGSSPPPPPPPPPPRSIQIGWSGAHHGWIWMTLNGFSTGQHQYTCAFASGGNQTFTLTETSSPQSWDNGHTCYDLIHGDRVWVVVEGVASNTITVP